jgi:hypothetical protein
MGSLSGWILPTAPLWRQLVRLRRQRRHNRKLHLKRSLQFFLNRAPIIRHVEQFLLEATLRGKAEDKRVVDETHGMTGEKNRFQDAPTTSQAFQQCLPLGGDLRQGGIGVSWPGIRLSWQIA